MKDFDETILEMIQNPTALGSKQKLEKPLSEMDAIRSLPTQCNLNTYIHTLRSLNLEETRAAIWQSYQQSQEESSIVFPRHSFKGKNVVTSKKSNTVNIHLCLEPAYAECIMGRTVVLLTNSKKPSLKLLGYATKTFKSVKVNIPVEGDYYTAHKEQFNKKSHWNITPLESLQKSKLIHDVTYQDNLRESPCMSAILAANTSHLNMANTSGSGSMFNQDQHKVIDYVLNNHRVRGVTCLQGPPGTGKSTVISHIARSLQNDRQRVLITCVTNKGVQELAERMFLNDPRGLLLLCTEEKSNPILKSIQYDSWYETLLDSLEQLETFADEVNSIPNETAAIEALNRLKPAISGLLDEIAGKISRSTTLQQFINLSVLAEWRPVLNESLESRHRLTECSILNQQLKYAYQSIANQCDSSAIMDEVLKQKSLIIFATTAMIGNPKYVEKISKVDFVCLDEASLATEAETLLILPLFPQHLLYVGDPKQLPPVVVSEVAKRKHYDRSFMHRAIIDNSAPYFMLTEQFRMQSAICEWISKQFYNDRLTTKICYSLYDFLPEYQPASSDHIPTIPIQFFNISSAQENFGQAANEEEAKHAITLAKQLRKQYGGKPKIGIICMYKKQANYVKDQVTLFGLDVSVGTIDAYQGSECDFIIVSCVRCNSEKKLGFINDERRINVAMSRAKQQLLIIGDATTLSSNASFESLILYADFLKFNYEMMADIQQFQAVPQKIEEAFALLPQSILSPKTASKESAEALFQFRGMVESNLERAIQNKTVADFFLRFMRVESNPEAADISVKKIQTLLQAIGLLTMTGLIKKKSLLGSFSYFNRIAFNEEIVLTFLELVEKWVKMQLFQKVLQADILKIFNMLNSDDSENQSIVKELDLILSGLMYHIEENTIAGVSASTIWPILKSLKSLVDERLMIHGKGRPAANTSLTIWNAPKLDSESSECGKKAVKQDDFSTKAGAL